ncbi:CDK5RAP1-like protein [Primulina eburnea]|uniref:CDK5RAP1-like protein n=1 Tax=Primulina eburnea TaxID=1245227 RepID=UPI003C6C08D2
MASSSSLTSTMSSVLSQHHCINLQKRCSIITLRFLTSCPRSCSPVVSADRFSRRRRDPCALSIRFARSFWKTTIPGGRKHSEISSLHHFMPNAAAAVVDVGASDTQLDSETVSDVLQRDRIYHETYGCQMNVNDMEIVLSIMKNAGYGEIVEVPESAEIIFINTCAIRDNAEQKVWQRLNYFWFLKRQWKSNVATGRSESLRPPKVVVLGCMAERLKDKILDADKMVDVVCGPDAYRDLPRLLEEVDSGQKGINTLLSLEETYADINPVRISKNAISAFVSIMRGCNNVCSFCIVPFTRGRERSRPVESIVREVAELWKEGVKEVTLLGQNVNSYNDTSAVEEVESGINWKYSDGFASTCKVKTMGLRFADLLERLAVEFPEMRFRFTSPHPKDFPDELLYVMRDRYNICKSIHLPAQSGSSTVLERMRRGYTQEAYIDLVKKIKTIIPDIGISSDFICGFCGETEEDHQDTLSLVRSVVYDMAYMFAYSMREKTHAHRNYVDDIPDSIKQRRLTELIDAFRESTGQHYDSKIGSIQLVLVEGTNKRAPDTELIGKSDRGHRVSFSNIPIPDMIKNDGKRNPEVGDFVEVRITKSTRASLHGEALAITKLSSFYVSTHEESVACAERT